MSIKFPITGSLLALVAGLSLATAMSARADDIGSAAVPQMAPQEETAFHAGNVSDEQLEKYVNVHLKKGEIEDKYRTQVNGAETMDEFDRIRHKMEGEVIDAIHAEDLSLEEYEQLELALGENSSLRARATQIINEKWHKGH